MPWKVFCVATSRIILSEQRAVDAVESGGVGIAQLFKHFRRPGSHAGEPQPTIGVGGDWLRRHGLWGSSLVNDG